MFGLAATSSHIAYNFVITAAAENPLIFKSIRPEYSSLPAAIQQQQQQQRDSNSSEPHIGSCPQEELSLIHI